MTTRQAVFTYLSRMPRGNPNGTLFIGVPEIRDLAYHCFSTPQGIGRVIRKIALKHGVKARSIDGFWGYEIPMSAFQGENDGQ